MVTTQLAVYIKEKYFFKYSDTNNSQKPMLISSFRGRQPPLVTLACHKPRLQAKFGDALKLGR